MASLDNSRWAEIESILDRALDAPPSERPEIVANACAGDGTLEARVLELLAAARPGAEHATHLASIVPTVYAEALAQVGEATRLEPGHRLGHYRIVQRIGVGGMGEVYLAERADGEFERRVALKILPKLEADPAHHDRFRQERQILANLEHEHIAPLLDGGVSGDGRPFFALQFVDGLPITDYCAQHRLGPDERVALLLQACEAVQYANGQGVVHRDLKPANLLVSSRADGPPHLSVLDFGIARLAGGSDLTQTGDVLGTPAYMAPEQARGEVESVDRRTDVFALGVVLYELLCDHRPFEGETPMEVHAAVLRADPVLPRPRVPTLPRDLETVIVTCLEHSADRRYPSVRALAEDLERYLAGEPIAARGRTPVRRLTLWASRRPLVSAMLAALVLLTFAGGGVLLHERKMAQRGAEIAARYGQAAEQVAATMRFEHLLDLHDTAGARQRLAGRLARLESELESMPSPARAPGRLALGRGYLALGQLDPALEQLDRAWARATPEAALTLAEAELERYRRDRTLAEKIGDPTLRRTRLDELAMRSRERALQLRALAAERSVRVELLEAQIAFLEGDRDRARHFADSTLRLAPWRYESHLLHAEIAWAELEDARARGDSSEVLAHVEQARDAFLVAAEIAPSDPTTHLQVCALASTEVELRLHDLAGNGDAAAAAGLAACARALTADSASPEALIEESTLRVIYARDLSRRDAQPFEQVDGAVAAAERAIGLAETDVRAHRRLGDAWIFRAEFERERGLDSSASLAHGATALARAAELAPNDATVWNSLGLLRWEEALLAQGRSEDVRPPTRAAVDAFERAVAIEPGSAYAWGNLGTMHNWLAAAEVARGGNALPHLDEAETALRRALEIYPAYVTARNNLGNVEHNRGELLLARGDDAREPFRRAVEAFDRILEIKPDWAFPHFNRARSGIALALARLAEEEDPKDDLDSAREALAAALALRRDLVDGHLLAAELETTQARREMAVGGSPSSAVAAARRAIDRARALDAGAGTEQEAALRALPTTSSR
ncbi:MAG: protein kinase [Acidobacteriota bacterium]